MKVSVVIPVYNAEKYIGECLDSLISQTFSDIEIVCVNDGSSDGSLRVLEEYAECDERIRVFTKENEGKGAASARNMGLENACGEYIQFVDNDDFFEPDMIESLVKKAEDTEAEVVVFRGQFYDDSKGCITGPLPHPDLQYAPSEDGFSWKECPEYICEIADFYAWNKFYKRQLLIDNDLKFTPNPIADDQDISMLAPIYAKKVAVIDRPLLNYRVGTGVSQSDAKTKHPEAGYIGTFSVVNSFRKMGIYEDVKQSYLNVAIRLMREYFDFMTEYDKVRFLYDKYIDEIFPMLGAENLPENYFHDWRVESWYRMIISTPLEEMLFAAARASGGSMTTAPLRFQVPYDEIEKNSRIVLVGRGLVGRYWYSQLLLSDYCEVVSWVGSEDDVPGGLEYDQVVVAR